MLRLNKPYLKYILSALIPLFVLIVIYVCKSIAPFGNNTLLYADLQSQYTIFYSELCDKIKAGENLFLNLNRSLGTDYLSEIGYYCASPFIIIAMLFSSSAMPTAVSLVVLIKCSLAGLFAFIYFKKHYKNFDYDILFLAISTCYALSSYFVNYYANIMWLDGFMIFPLIMLGLERLVTKKRYVLYTLSLFYAIITNFYVGFMICIFCCLYFAYLNLLECKSFKQLISNCLRFSLFSLISGGLSAFLLIPLAYNLSFSEPSTYGMFEKVRMYYSPIISVFRQQILAKPTFMHDPYLYSSILVLLALPVFIIEKQLPLRQRIGKIVLYIILLESFRFSVLDYIWNGFHHVNCLAARQSFIFIFIALTILADVLTSKLPSGKILIYSYLTVMGLCALSMLERNFTAVMLSTIYSIIALSAFVAIIYWLPKKSINLTYIFISVLILFETCFNAYNSIHNLSSYDSYTLNIDKSSKITDTIKDSSFYRIKNDTKEGFNSSSLGKYRAIANYSSMQNYDSLMFLYNIGYPVYINTLDDISYEPVFLSLLGVKYIYTENDYNGASGLSLLQKTNSEYLYQNSYAKSLGIVLPSTIKDFKFTHDTNPFEQINDFVKETSSVPYVYEKVKANGDTLEVDENTQLFIYNKASGTGQKFITKDNAEEIFSTYKNGLYMHRKGIDDNYIYYVYSSPKGGYIKFDTKNQADNLVAYTLNASKYDKYFEELNANSFKINNYTNNHISATISVKENSLVMTSLAYNKGFRVYIDGKEVNTYSISNALLAFDIDVGTHEVTIHYVSYGLTTGVIISLSSLILLITITLTIKKRAAKS